MNNANIRLLINGLIIIVLAALILVTSIVLTAGIREDSVLRNRNLAIGELIAGERVTDSSEFDDDQIVSILELTDGGSVTELSVQTGYVTVSLLVRLDRRGSYMDHRIISFDNPVNGWDFGNAFFAGQLANHPRETPALASGGNFARRMWGRDLARAIQTAQEFRP